MTVHVHTIIIKHTVCSFQIQNKCKWYACYIIQQKYTCTKCINWPTWTDVLQWKLFPLMETCPGHSMNTSFCHIKISSFNLSEISQIFSYFALKSTERGLRSVVSVNFNQSKAWKSHLRLILDLRLFVKSTPGVTAGGGLTTIVINMATGTSLSVDFRAKYTTNIVFLYVYYLLDLRSQK
jgi:hypothetical protein